MFDNLSDKYITVTGASGQLGSEISRILYGLGAKVIGVDLIKPASNVFWDFYVIDVSDENSVKRMFASENFHKNPISGLVNNAGHSIFSDFNKRTQKEFFETFQVNLWGAFLMMNEFGNLRYEVSDKTQNWRSIVNISSIYGIVSPDFRVYGESDRKNSEVYGATKAGLIQMSRYFSVAFAGNQIRVNSISPGGIFNDKNPQSDNFVSKYSDRVPMNRMANVKEIAQPVIYLLSDASSYITGTNLIVDGGLSAL